MNNQTFAISQNPNYCRLQLGQHQHQPLYHCNPFSICRLLTSSNFAMLNFLNNINIFYCRQAVGLCSPDCHWPKGTTAVLIITSVVILSGGRKQKILRLIQVVVVCMANTISRVRVAKTSQTNWRRSLSHFNHLWVQST